MSATRRMSQNKEKVDINRKSLLQWQTATYQKRLVRFTGWDKRVAAGHDSLRADARLKFPELRLTAGHDSLGLPSSSISMVWERPPGKTAENRPLDRDTILSPRQCPRSPPAAWPALLNIKSDEALTLPQKLENHMNTLTKEEEAERGKRNHNAESKLLKLPRL